MWAEKTVLGALGLLVEDPAVLEDSWEREPFVSSPGGDMDAVLTVQDVQGLLEQGLPLSAVRLFQEGRQIPQSTFARRRVAGGRDRSGLADAAAVTAKVAAGATLVVDDLETFHPPLAAFAAELSKVTGYDADCTVFLTPSGRSRGLAPHQDPVSGFLRQLHGSKRWRVSPGQERWPARRTGYDAGGTPDRAPQLDVVLKEGQCLYIPRGYVHVGETTDGPSAHLSVGLRAATWGEVLRTLVAEAELRHEELRASLPPAFSTADREEELRSRTALLAAELLAVRWEQLQPERFRHAQVPLPAAPGSLAAALERRAG